MFKHVLIPLDGSELAERALEQAEHILGAGEGEITLLTAVNPPEFFTYDSYNGQTLAPAMMSARAAVNYQAITDELVKDAQSYLDRIAQRLQSAGYRVHRKIEIGLPAEAILKTAEESRADAIVMSTHGRSGLSRWILGSVTHKVLSAANCPIFITPPKHA
jgi:nucleotide-binding universal stress UspA family protein